VSKLFTPNGSEVRKCEGLEEKSIYFWRKVQFCGEASGSRCIDCNQLAVMSKLPSNKLLLIISNRYGRWQVAWLEL